MLSPTSFVRWILPFKLTVWPLTWFKPTMPNESHVSHHPRFELAAKGKFCTANVILIFIYLFIWNCALPLGFPCIAMNCRPQDRDRAQKWRRRVTGNSWNGFRYALSSKSIRLLKVCFEFRSALLQCASISIDWRCVAYLPRPFGPRIWNDNDQMRWDRSGTHQVNSNNLSSSH